MSDDWGSGINAMMAMQQEIELREKLSAALAECERLRGEVEQRRLRAARAVELLRADFALRSDCSMVDDAAEDACADASRLRARVAELEGALRVTRKP